MANKLKKNMYVADSAKDYSLGYRDGAEEHRDTALLRAYYTGVGYGKHQGGVEQMGFNSLDEKKAFAKGVEKHRDHFNSYRYKKPGFFERFFRSIRIHKIRAPEKEIKEKTFQRIQGRHKKYAAKVRARQNKRNKIDNKGGLVLGRSNYIYKK